MTPRPLRLTPGVDLRQELEKLVSNGHVAPGFVIAGIGSIADAALRFAGEEAATAIAGQHELLTLSGSLSKDGAHLHMSIANSSGQVFGGHVCYGNTVRTTAEVLLLETPDWTLSRTPDGSTGYKELVVRQDAIGAGSSAA